MNAITINDLSKIYDDGKKALDSVSIGLSRGEVFGFLGPNGAGKTTAVKLLTGMLSPTSGSCEVLGINPAAEPEKAHALSGVVTEHAQMYDNMTGLENLVFYGTLFGLGMKESKNRGRNLLKHLELSEASDKKLSAYSTGMRQRLSLARALIHEPEILFLDEPTSGLDPESAQNVHAMIRSLAREKGITVFLCTHQLRYAQEICTRYGLLSRGKLLAEGTLDELRSEISSDIPVKLKASSLPDKLPCRQTGCHEYELTVSSETEIPEIVRRIVASGGDIYHVSARLPSLEDIYFALTQSLSPDPKEK